MRCATWLARDRDRFAAARASGWCRTSSRSGCERRAGDGVPIVRYHERDHGETRQREQRRADLRQRQREARREIRVIGDPVLREHAHEVTAFDREPAQARQAHDPHHARRPGRRPRGAAGRRAAAPARLRRRRRPARARQPRARRVLGRDRGAPTRAASACPASRCRSSARSACACAAWTSTASRWTSAPRASRRA